MLSRICQHCNKPAIIFRDSVLTYKDVVSQTLNIVDIINSNVTQPFNKIGFILDRSPVIITTMLAIIETDNCYVPIDPSYPLDRINYICENIDVLIVDNSTKDIVQYKGKIINIDEYVVDAPRKFLDVSFRKNQLAYIIYTSGSTGKPKGVMISYDSLMKMVESAIERLSITHDDKILQYASIGFDAAGWDIYISLISGASLYMIDNNTRINPIDCFQFIKDNKLTFVTITPSSLAEFPKIELPFIKCLIIMGEMSQSQHMDFWSENHSVYNGYGPTEATIATTIKRYKPGDLNSDIGSPLSSHDVYIFGEDTMNEISNESHEMGEIYIGGPCVAIGYYGNEKLTDEKFINHPNYGRLYKTGDLGRWLNNRNLEILGRKDNQVKIHGVRVEIEDIESHIGEIKSIKSCAVIYTDQRLTCFYTTFDDTPVDETSY
jgi:amino acid adenylation domain-containing protein